MKLRSKRKLASFGGPATVDGDRELAHDAADANESEDDGKSTGADSGSVRSPPIDMDVDEPEQLAVGKTKQTTNV